MILICLYKIQYYLVQVMKIVYMQTDLWNVELEKMDI